MYCHFWALAHFPIKSRLIARWLPAGDATKWWANVFGKNWDALLKSKHSHLLFWFLKKMFTPEIECLKLKFESVNLTRKLLPYQKSYCGWLRHFHHQKDDWKPVNHGRFTTSQSYQLVQDPPVPADPRVHLRPSKSVSTRQSFRVYVNLMKNLWKGMKKSLKKSEDLDIWW